MRRVISSHQKLFPFFYNECEFKSSNMSHREDINDAHDLQLEELARYFHMPIAEAAKEIGVCATVLKKICRKNNIPRWPHRKIKSINKMISTLRDTLGKNPEDDKRIMDEINTLYKHKEYVMKNPDSLVKNVYNKRKKASAAPKNTLSTSPKDSFSAKPQITESYDHHVEPFYCEMPYLPTYTLPFDINPNPNIRVHNMSYYVDSDIPQVGDDVHRYLPMVAPLEFSLVHHDLPYGHFYPQDPNYMESPRVVEGGVISTTSPRTVLPEWYHEEKDNCMALQEKMGLV